VNTALSIPMIDSLWKTRFIKKTTQPFASVLSSCQNVTKVVLFSAAEVI